MALVNDIKNGRIRQSSQTDPAARAKQEQKAKEAKAKSDKKTDAIIAKDQAEEKGK